MITFKERLQEIVSREGINQTQLAQKIGVTKTAITEWAMGRAVPTPGHKKKIALTFPNINVYWVWGLDSEPYFRVVTKKVDGRQEETILSENKLLRQRISDLETIIQMKNELIDSLKTTK